MDCSKIADHLSPFLDGELEDEKAERVRAHLAKCPRCSKSFQDHVSVKQLLSQKFLPEKAPARLRSAILDRLDTSRLSDFFYTFSQRVRGRPVVATGVGVMVLAVMLVAIVLFVNHNRLPPLVAGLLNHYALARQPALEVASSDAGEVARRMGLDLQKEVAAAHLKGKWCFLLGARKCPICRKPAMEMRYLHPAGNLSFFAVSDPGQEEFSELRMSRRLQEKRMDGGKWLCCETECGRAVIWWQGGEIFALTSDRCLPSFCLLDIAGEIRSVFEEQQ